MKNKSLFINGVWKTAKGEEFTSLNPATNEVLWQGKAAVTVGVDAAVEAAKKAYRGWSVTAIERRKEYINHFAQCLKDEKENLSLTISQETGKPLWESRMEVEAMINKIPISFEAYDERCRFVEKEMAGAIRKTQFKAHGVMAVFGPFNLPGHLPNGHIIPALLAGNTIVFKPSEQTPLVAQKYIECWQKTGLPRGVINLVQGGKVTGKILSSHQNINGLLFTGSYRVGKILHQVFGGYPEKILALEMGGNNPLIVDDVKDLVAAAYMTIQSAFITSGQRCVCSRRLIVLKGEEGDEFIKCLIEMTAKIQVGSYDQQPEPFMGPVISKKAADDIVKYQNQLKRKGGKILLAVEKLQEGGAFLSPGIIDVTRVKQKEDEEIFGPLLQVIRVKDFTEAVNEANNTVFGLSAGILTDQKDKFRKFYEQSRAGIVNWNRPLTGASSQAPFGGVGRSGNHQPSAYFAADYCAYPVASIENEKLTLPEKLTPGIKLS
ncbi:MAG: succinylglutamate-semialdehyde dehydrogenase [Candidatus Omnitrophica bacterium]|nr:succinylglutamate-semialdehyde dehydrogenase [Candidatus Omnitrophota bacterium]MCB9747543.1 succinylglutamate-semialdehyde dehydrogenase [Candidatus Omnitrophota bacterium]